MKKVNDLLNRACELLCELERNGNKEQKKRIDKFFEDVQKYAKSSNLSSTKQSVLADIECLDMLKTTICSECDSFLDYSELKDKMCSKCGTTNYGFTI